MSFIRTPITKEQVLAGTVVPQTMGKEKAKPKKKFVNVETIIREKPSNKVLKKWLITNIEQIEADQNVLTLYSQ